jgi:NhaP-type Na+/H+ or K+/H+ antiporter
MNLAEYPEFLFALIGLLGIAAQWFSWWLKLPAILFLLLIGVVAGPVTGLIRPNELLGELLFPLVSLGVAVILFEGSLTLRFSQIKGLQNAVRNLVTVGALINWLTIGVATRYLLDLSWDLALLFGALVTVTGPTVIVPMLRTVRPNDKIASVLRWEGIIVDPIGALLAVLVFGFIVSGQEEQAILVFTETVLVGGLIGVMGAYILATILRRRLMPDYLHNVATLVLVLGIFSGANILEHESGLLAVTVMGIMLANMKGFSIQDILDFKAPDYP